ncbi:MAG: glycosyltransferase family 2 protein [Chloroflexi bacterium]|nr:glycosyltransferase family 2 protein [Chloroflexota bacterium]
MDNDLSLDERTYSEMGLQDRPMVTIITVVLNGVRYLETCIESVLNQSYPHIEHLFIDGGSKDGTVDVLSSYSNKYPKRIQFISENDDGWSDAMNKGVTMAEGVILGNIGSDDVYEPGAIEAVVEFFRENPSAHLVFGDSNLIDEKGEIIDRFRTKHFNLKDTINGNQFPAGPSTFYSRELFEKIGLFDSWAGDLDLLIRAGKVFPIYRINKVLSSYRVHKGSLTTGSWERRKKQFREIRIISRRHGGSIFSVYSRVYYAYVLIDWLRPIFGSIYPFIGKVTGKNIGKSKDDWAIRRKG